MYNEDNDYFHKNFLMMCNVMQYWPTHILHRLYLLLCQKKKFNELGLSGLKNPVLSLKIFAKIDKWYEKKNKNKNPIPG